MGIHFNKIDEDLYIEGLLRDFNSELFDIKFDNNEDISEYLDINNVMNLEEFEKHKK